MGEKSKELSDVKKKGMNKEKLHLSLPGLTGFHAASYKKVQQIFFNKNITINML
jgi:hypothetical protein